MNVKPLANVLINVLITGIGENLPCLIGIYIKAAMARAPTSSLTKLIYGVPGKNWQIAPARRRSLQLFESRFYDQY